jgi:glyoxylase-like metal-dependent hydrolase (beta-lactamase superfamily II)
MTGSNYKNAPLQWSVFITERPGLNRELPPGYESLAWVPNSSTLIYGERDAVLVDTFLTAEASQALADWVMASGKNLTTIYLTHGHGDHFFGIGLLKQRFHARAVARPDIVEAMRHELNPPYFNSFWNSADHRGHAQLLPGLPARQRGDEDRARILRPDDEASWGSSQSRFALGWGDGRQGTP